MAGISRRSFLKLSAAAAAAGTILHPRNAAAFTGRYATIIDITRCDGCRDIDVPRCVTACREQNRQKFPEPIKNIKPYWPHKFYEDWSRRRDVTTTLQPYNWIFVQRVDVPASGAACFVPRRCMHCDKPPCVSLCPFGALSKEREGNTVISDSLCFGGAKCRDVCPWHIPQRQAGVGLYLKVMPLLAGGGVMYKCDLCSDRIREGKRPACVDACTERPGRETAMLFDTRRAIFAMARDRAAREGLHTYGLHQNGGTSTVYLSKIPFSAIDAGLKAKKEKFGMPVDVANPLDGPHRLAKYFLGGTIVSAGIAVAGAFIAKSRKGPER
jgi:Fe-S-cluster-containing dehydrogenase component